MDKPTKTIIIVGGGSAGWLTAGVIAAEHRAKHEDGLDVILIESPEISTIGVGEGTWPSMRHTLRRIGVCETDLFRECEASFKQGAKFSKWVDGSDKDFYYHPLVDPVGYTDVDLGSVWQSQNTDQSFADTVSFQSHLCEAGKAPKQITTPEYAAVANYAYHLNTTKLGEFLRQHCTTNLGVKHVVDHVIQVNSHDNQDIKSLTTKKHGELCGDLFIDCSGSNAILLGKHYGIPLIDKKSVLFNDRALAIQVPYPQPDTPIASHTISTAQSAGWIWDIGLPTRRGVGNVYSSAHISDEEAELELRRYIEPAVGEKTTANLSVRRLTIQPGYREKFWHKNCVAVGMAAGFLEPLEASALVMVELSAAMICDEMPVNRTTMEVIAKRFNDKFHYRWQRIIDFLKFHYVLTKRTDTDYWIDNCRKESQPESLQELMTLWQYHRPNRYDFPQVEEVFGSSSWQYIMYGMDYQGGMRSTACRFADVAMAREKFLECANITRQYLQHLPDNRVLINKIIQHGMSKV